MRLKAVAALIMIAAVLTSSTVIAVSRLKPPRQVNPATLSGEPPPPLQLLSIYLSIANSLRNYDFRSAVSNLSVIAKAYVPASIRYVFSRFNNLLKQLIRYVNESRTQAVIAKQQLRISNYVGARKAASKGLRILDEAGITYYELSRAAAELSRLGIPMYKVRELLNTLSDAMKALRTTLLNLMSNADKALRGAKETELSITVTPTNITYGGEVVIKGNLTSGGEGIPGREVLIHVGNSFIKALTNSLGEYSAKAPIKEYRKEVTVYSEYIPRGPDKELYMYSKSRQVLIKVHYVTPKINLWLSKEAVTPEESVLLEIRTMPNLTLIIKGLSKTSIINSGSGITTAEIRVPPQTPSGTYRLTVESLPKGIIGPAKASVTIRVYRLEPQLIINAPPFIMTGLKYELTIKSNVKAVISAEALTPDTSVRANGNAITVSAANTYLGSMISIKVTASPLNPKYRVKYEVIKIPSYNTLLIAITAAIISGATAVTIERLRREGVRRGATRQGRLGRVEAVRKHEAGVKRVGGELPTLFAAIIKMIEALSKAAFKASYTIREYLGVIRGSIPSELYPRVEKALLSLEKLIYGGPRYSNLANTVRKLLKDLINSLRRLVRGEGVEGR